MSTYCNTVHASAHNKTIHERKHGKTTMSGKMQCSFCNKMMFKYSLPGHVKGIHRKYENISIHSSAYPQCGKGFSNVWKLERHLRMKHSIYKQSSKIKPGQGPSEVVCRLCDTKFHTQSSYALHFKSTHGKSMCKESITCLLCDKRYDTIECLHRHYSIVQTKKKLKLHCSLCTKYFRHEVEYEKHKREYHKNDRCSCGLCSLDFDKVKAWNLHVLKHNTFSK